jgi:hypothetical protein
MTIASDALMVALAKMVTDDGDKPCPLRHRGPAERCQPRTRADLCGLTTRPNGLVLRLPVLRICCAEPGESPESASDLEAISGGDTGFEPVTSPATARRRPRS